MITPDLTTTQDADVFEEFVATIDTMPASSIATARDNLTTPA
jgi:hypothetical protein